MVGYFLVKWNPIDQVLMHVTSRNNTQMLGCFKMLCPLDVLSTIRHKYFRPSVLLRLFVTLRGLPWILKQGGQEDSGQRLISLNGKTKKTQFYVKIKLNKLFNLLLHPKIVQYFFLQIFQKKLYSLNIKSSLVFFDLCI